MAVASGVMRTAKLNRNVTLVEGHVLVVRAMQRIIGFSLILAASGLWLHSGASWDVDQIVLKLALTPFFCLLGASILSMGHSSDTH